MQVRTNLRQSSHGIEQIVAHVARKIGDELDPFDARRVVDASQQICESWPTAVAQIVLIAVDGLAEQSDLFCPFRGELANLGRDFFRMPALFWTPHAGHDAVGTELVAADHDPHVRLKARWPHRWIAERIVALEAVLNLRATGIASSQADRELEDSGPLGILNQFRQASELAGSADDVDVRSSFLDQLLIFLSHAAEDADDLLRMAPLVGTQ